jgi:hypothetical protein
MPSTGAALASRSSSAICARTASCIRSPHGQNDHAHGLGSRLFGYSRRMSIITVLGAVGGLHALFLLALVVTNRHDVEARPTAFAGPPTHVRLLRDDPLDPRRTTAAEHMTFLLGN